AATLQDVRTFFHTYYAPNNAVLLMIGDVEPQESFEFARRYFESIPPHPAVPSADTSEPRQLEERRGEVEEKFGQLPALAIGFNMPQRHERDWYASVLLDRVLHGGRAGRIHRSLVLEKQIAIAAEGGMGFPDAFEYNGPTLGTTTIYHKPEYSPESTIAAFDEVIAEVRDKTLDTDELDQIKVKCRADYFSMLESGGAGVPRFGLMHALACFTLFDNDPQRVNTVLDKFLSVTPAEIQATAQKYLLPKNRSIVFRRPIAHAADNGAHESETQGIKQGAKQ
ncbi:MAG: M16 family metallopeptidase, partial [Candidatus Acidiferrales bacterium]